MTRCVRALAGCVTGVILFTGCFFDGDGGLEPVDLLPTSEVGTRWVKLAWTPSADPDFLEYQLYRGYDPSFDEDLSELIYTGTDRGVTRLTDEGEAEFGGLDPGEIYYYRVFVVDTQGRRTGSNIRAVETREWEVDEFDVEYALEPVAEIAGDAEVRGIAASDECLWIVTLTPRGGYYDNDLTRLTCRDHATGQTVRSFDYEDEYIEPNGVAWTGSHLWLNHCNQLGCDTARLKRIDPATGEVDKTMIADSGTHDLAWDGEHLLLANHWNQIQVVDPDTGDVIRRLEVPFDYSTTRGVAARAGEIWVSSQANDQIVVLDPDGNHIGLVDGAPLDDEWTYAWDLHLDFSGDDLVMVSDSHVTTFSISTR